MKLPSFKRIFSQDFSQDDQSLVSQLSLTINQGLEQLYFALNNGLSLSDNIAGTVTEFTVQVASSGIPTSRTTFKLRDANRITQIVVGKADNLTNSGTYPTGGIFVSWTQVPEGILVNHITGLQPGDQYLIRVMAYN